MMKNPRGRPREYATAQPGVLVRLPPEDAKWLEAWGASHGLRLATAARSVLVDAIRERRAVAAIDAKA